MIIQVDLMQAKKIALSKKWLKVDPCPSWKKVITALEGTGEYALAKDVADIIEKSKCMQLLA